MIEDSNLVINQEEECHKVKAYSMKAIKYLGNSIMCDDRERVTIIDPNTMDIIGSVPKSSLVRMCSTEFYRVPRRSHSVCHSCL